MVLDDEYIFIPTGKLFKVVSFEFCPDDHSKGIMQEQNDDDNYVVVTDAELANEAVWELQP